MSAALFVLLLGAAGMKNASASQSNAVSIEEDDPITFADGQVKALCVSNWDTNGDGELSYAEASMVTDIGRVFQNKTAIFSFDELQYFTGLNSIGEYAFYYCQALTSITIPSSVTAIGNFAFEYCVSLSSIYIPAAVTSLEGYHLFSNCDSLEQIIVDPNNSIFDSRDNCNAIIETSTNTLKVGCKNTIIPNTVTVIGANSFWSCNALTSIDIPNSVQIIGNSAFRFCRNLSSVTIGNSVNTIEEYAFYSCSGLTSVTLPTSLRYIKTYAFEYCSSLASITIPSSVSLIGRSAFTGCTNMEQMIVESGNPYFDSRENCNAIIRKNTNKLISGCKNTIIPNTVTTIGEDAFLQCDGLTSIEIPNSVTVIEDYAFCLCDNLTSIEIPNSVISLGRAVFMHCDGLTSVVLPNTITSLQYGVFFSCDGLTSIEIPNSVTSIEYEAFHSCSGLKNVIIPNSVTSIGHDAFSECSDLLSVTLGNSVATIDYYAFKSCNSLTSIIVLADTPPALGQYVFYDTPTDITVCVPCGLEETYQAANGWDDFSTITGMCSSGTVTVSSNPAEGGYVTGAGTYQCGDTCTVTAAASDNYTFMYWTENGSVVSTQAEYTFIVPVDRDLVAHFTLPLNVTTVASPTQGGTMTGAGEYTYGSTCTLTATPNENYTFMYWEKNNGSRVTNATHSFTVTSDCEWTAYFSLPLNITVSANPSNGGSVTGGGEFTYGSACTVTATPIGDYSFMYWAYWSGYSWIQVSINPVYSFTVYSSRDLKAFFGLPFTVTATANMAEGGTVTGCGEYNYGSTCTVTATPNEGYVFLNWSRDGVVMSCNASYSFIVRGNETVEANFMLLEGYLVGEGEATNYDLPSSYACNYSMSQQIYTSDEIGVSGNIISVSFYDAGEGYLRLGGGVGPDIPIPDPYCPDPWGGDFDSIRHLDIYMVHSNKYCFDSPNDWIPITNADLVFSGDVTLTYGYWTTIDLDVPFAYDGISNLALVVNDSSSMYNMSIDFRVFDAQGYQAISVKSYDTGFDPNNPSDYSGTLLSVKNQIIFGMSPTFDITATLSNPEAGTISGSGQYASGSVCTLTATPNEGYAFANWTENDSVVSDTATYSFTVTGDRNLVANFIPTATHWAPESAGTIGSMVLIGKIQINGIDQTSNQLELGIFCGDECRGSCIAHPFTYGQLNYYLVDPMVYGEAGDTFTFKLYDHGVGEELDLTSPAAISYVEDGYGTVFEPYVLNFISSVEIATVQTPAEAGTVSGAGVYLLGSTCTLVATANEGYQFKNWTLNGETVSIETTYSFTVSEAATYMAHFDYVHTQSLAAGWNWWGTYIEMDSVDGLEMLKNSLGDSCVRIQSRNQYLDNYGNFWYGNLTEITNEQCYMIRTNAECEAVLVGEIALPENHPITINNGWNWISFPSSQSVSVGEAMSGFDAELNDQIKSRHQYASYLGNGFWYGTLNNFEPGQGFMYKSNSNEPKTLVYEIGQRKEVVANVTTEDNVFTPFVENYADNMTITAIVELDGMELRSEEYELAVFVGCECRGSVKLMYVEPINRYMAFLTAFGENGEEMHYVLTDGKDAVSSDNGIRFTANGTIGTIKEPVLLQFGTLGLNGNGQETVSVFPNPSNDIFNVEGNGIRKVEVINAYGQILFSKEKSGSRMQINLDGEANGIYMLRVTINQGIITNQIIKK